MAKVTEPQIKQTNKFEKLMFGQIFIISFFNSDYKLNLNFKILMN